MERNVVSTMKRRARGHRFSRARMRISQGFTMVETVVVVALLAILAGFAFVNVAQHLKNMYQMELDQTAKEIYVAAQNHLTVAESTGQLKGKKGKDLGESAVGTYVLFIPGAPRNIESDIWPTMLPYGSIDETVRLGGSYVIRYKYTENKGSSDSATVMDVFYANPNGSSVSFGQYGHTFSDEEVSTLFSETSNYTNNDDTGKTARHNYGDDGDVIGYYGGENPPDAKDAPDVPLIQVKNAEKLQVVIKNGSKFQSSGTKEYKLELYVTGATSGIQYGPINIKESTPRFDNTTGEYEYTYDLDSITDAGGHFKEKFPQLIAGEDIRLQVFAMRTDTVAPITKSARVTTNSLFGMLTKVRKEDGNLKTDVEGNQIRAARITNIRHLENLSTAISGFDNDPKWETAYKHDPTSSTGEDGTESIAWKVVATSTAKADALAPESAYQSKDLDWNDFRKQLNEKYEVSSVVVRGLDKEGASAPVSVADTFMPINPDYKLVFDGEGHQVKNLNISNGETTNELNAGLFGTLGNADEISNLEIVNPSISTSNGLAGALAAVAKGKEGNAVTINNVYVYNDIAKYTKVISSDTIPNEYQFEISGSGDTGGLVGKLEGKSEVDECAAAVYVHSTGGNAGGLIGAVGASGIATIKHSQSGGHTENGLFKQAKDATTGEYVPVTSGDARMNVQSNSAAAGGLVGSVPSDAAATIKYSYSTASAYSGGTVAGGLVGSASEDTEIEKSYAAGFVAALGENPTIGAFVGVANGAKFTDCQYLSIVNPGTPIISGQEDGAGVQGVTAFDENLTSYRGMEAQYKTVAIRYDKYSDTNKEGLGSQYPFKGALELDTNKQDGLSTTGTVGTDNKIVPVHYGDWPQYETLVVNTKGSSVQNIPQGS